MTFPWYLPPRQMARESGHCSCDPVLTYCILTQMSGFALLTSLCSCYPSSLPKLNLRPQRQEYSWQDSAGAKKKRGGNAHQAQSRAKSHTWIGQTDGINSKDNMAGMKTHCWMPVGFNTKMMDNFSSISTPQSDLFLHLINVVLEIWPSAFPSTASLLGSGSLCFPSPQETSHQNISLKNNS